MMDAFTTALSALRANGTAVDIIGNNLANLNTTGYKADAVQFSDLMSEQLGTSFTSQVGLGVSGAQSIREFTQGSIQQTNGPMDAAINGSGFFIVHDTGGQQLYTRAGNFRLGADGTLLTASGDHVQGWNSTNGAVDLTAAPSDIVVPVNGVVPANATSKMSVTANLNAQAAVGSSDASFSAPVQVIDSLGNAHVLNISFTKTGAGTWKYAVTVPAGDLKTGGSTNLATGNLTFNGSGVLTNPAAGSAPVNIKITGLADGANDLSVDWNLFDGSNGLITQYAQTSGVSAASQDGTQAGQIVKIQMGDDGMILASYSNGQQSAIAQLAMASIRNPETMISVGNNDLKAAPETAAPVIGTADSGGRGKIVGGSLESSTVDMASEFTNLITVQRSYQASSKVITTSDEMLQDLLQIRP
jgi:flagellar hook protein FlgE